MRPLVRVQEKQAESSDPLCEEHPVLGVLAAKERRSVPVSAGAIVGPPFWLQLVVADTHQIRQVGHACEMTAQRVELVVLMTFIHNVAGVEHEEEIAAGHLSPNLIEQRGEAVRPEVLLITERDETESLVGGHPQSCDSLLYRRVVERRDLPRCRPSGKDGRGDHEQ